jgi:hypothetical protein
VRALAAYQRTFRAETSGIQAILVVVRRRLAMQLRCLFMIASRLTV